MNLYIAYAIHDGQPVALTYGEHQEMLDWVELNKRIKKEIFLYELLDGEDATTCIIDNQYFLELLNK